MKKFLICAAIAVAGVAVWAASDNNAFKADDAEAQIHEIMAYGRWIGCCDDNDRNSCYITDGYITYCLDRALAYPMIRQC